MRPRSYLLIMTGAALLAAGAVAGLCQWVARPAIATRLSFVMERKTAALLAKREPVILAGRLNEWMLRWHLANRILETPEAAVLGSSHSLGVSGPLLGTERSMNFSISGSSMADYLLTTGILDTRDIRPKRWIVFVDPWLFDVTADFGAWYLWADELLRTEAELSARGPYPLYPFFSGNRYILGKRRTAAYSLEPLFHTFDGAIEESLLQAHRADGDTGGGQIMLADGSLAATADRQPPSAASVQKLALRQFLERPDRHRYGTYDRVDDSLWGYLERWMQRCREEGSEVWLVLSPYHPAIYPRITQSPRNQLQAVESRVREYSQRTGTPLLGSYDPTRAGMPAELFYDGDHLVEEGLRQLLAPIRETTPPKP